jgi:NAD(P)-dependent dehydrogenase (short-subunit alcohol dehydrogenase family)
VRSSAWPNANAKIMMVCRGLGALICEKFAAEGCNIAVNYNASKERAEDVAKKIEKEYKVKAIVIGGVRPVNPNSSDKNLTLC